MEGTSGAAERVSLRGDVRKAALYVGCRESEAQRGEPVDAALLKESSSSTVATPASDENRPATGGVRADQVGDKFPVRAIAAAERLPAGNRDSP